MSVVALAVDALLPALDIIGLSLGTAKPSDHKLLITMIFLGLGVGPMIFGPISDSVGRKPVVYIGFITFFIGSFICVLAIDIHWMVFGRIIQGIGLSSPRTISIAIIRDKFSGDYMARIMSFVTVVFLLIPIIAPATGKWILDVYDWQHIFYIQIGIGLLVMLWFWRRQEESLATTKRIPLTVAVFKNGFREVLVQPTTMGYTAIAGFIVGSFLTYLSSAQQIFQDQYELKEAFPYIFAALAIALGLAILLNASLVLKYGMNRIVHLSLLGFFINASIYVLLFYNSSNPPLYILLTFLSIQFFCIGFLFGNMRALAMQPVGHIAGIGAAITGLFSTLMAVPISTYIGDQIADTALPLFLGFSICAGIGVILLLLLLQHLKRIK